MTLRKRLKECEPYFIEHELLPRLYLKEDIKETEYWVFFYHFIRKLNYRAIGVRLSYDHSTIAYKINNILKTNNTIIEEFILNKKSTNLKQITPF